MYLYFVVSYVFHFHSTILRYPSAREETKCGRPNLVDRQRSDADPDPTFYFDASPDETLKVG
jgi:hypothetical protein